MINYPSRATSDLALAQQVALAHVDCARLLKGVTAVLKLIAGQLQEHGDRAALTMAVTQSEASCCACNKRSRKSAPGYSASPLAAAGAKSRSTVRLDTTDTTVPTATALTPSL